MASRPDSIGFPAPEADLPRWRRARRRAYWLLLRTLLLGADHAPLTMGRGLCRLLARLGLAVRPRERARARANLALAFPGLDFTEREGLLRSCADALGANLFDSLAAGRILSAGLVAEEPAPDGSGSLAATVAELAGRGRGVLILTGHLGCWELLGAWAAREFAAAGLGRLAVVTGTVHNAPVDELIQDRRRELGLEPLPRSEGARPLLEHLRSGGVAAILLDQNTRAGSLEAPFFGRPAPTPVALAALALKHGVPVVPVGLARRERGHEVRWLPPLPGEPAVGKVGEAETRAFLARCNEQLETLIRRNPAEWVWFHDRWNLDRESSPEDRQ